MKTHYKKRSQQGQVLLIVIMLVATAVTIVLSSAFSSRTDTQLSKLEEESQRALSAAEAAIELSLRTGAKVELDALSDYSDQFTGGAVIEETPTDQFLTPLIQKDSQYTFYLAKYDVPSNTFSHYWSGQIADIYFGSESGCPALELTFIKSDSTIDRWIIDPCSKIANGAALSLGASHGSYQFAGTGFNYQASASLPVENSKLLLIRVLAAPTKIGLKGTASFNLQGKTIVSQATNKASGVTKEVVLFQSGPQIPAEFFVTGFSLVNSFENQ